jgi:hypothetical protein
MLTLTTQPTKPSHRRYTFHEMKRYKTVARIFLILSVVNFTFAGLVQSRATQEAVVHSVKMAEDMTKASEKWHRPLDELSEPSAKRSTAMHAHSRDDSSDDSVTGPKADTPADSVIDDGKKFFSQELKEETEEDMVFTIVVGAVGGLVGQFRSGITSPADPGS